MSPVGSSSPPSASSSLLLSLWMSIPTAPMFPGECLPPLSSSPFTWITGQGENQQWLPSLQTGNSAAEKLYSLTGGREVNIGHFIRYNLTSNSPPRLSAGVSASSTGGQLALSTFQSADHQVWLMFPPLPFQNKRLPVAVGTALATSSAKHHRLTLLKRNLNDVVVTTGSPLVFVKERYRKTTS